MVTEAQKRARNKYDAGHYDKVSVKIPKGTGERIKATGASLAGFMTKATLQALSGLYIEVTPADRAAMEKYGTPEEIAAAAVRAAIEECKAGIYTPPDAP